MDLLQAVILSIVEGLTEFLPISSTGHLILAADILKIPETEFVKSFEVIIQFGAILAVVVLYFKTLSTNFIVWKKIIAAFLPTAVVGFFLYSFIKQYLLSNVEVVLWSLFIGGIILILWEKFYQKQKHRVAGIEHLSYKQAFIIGLFQSLSVIPGTSRAAATIIGAMTVGLERKTAVEFSFLLAVPTMAAATGLDLIKSNFNFTGTEWLVLTVGFLGAFITALFAVKYFVNFIKHHTFIPFGVYRIILAILFWFFLII